MRKKLLIILVVFCLVVIFFRFNNKNEEIRVRIIPRDNSIEGIEEKNKVKKVVLCYLENIYCDDYSKMLKEINTSYIDLEEELKEYVPDINVSFSKHTLYNKTYNNSAVENEEFYTLYIVLGEGKGDNWWGSVYPNYLNIEGDEEIQYKSLILEIFEKEKYNASN